MSMIDDATIDSLSRFLDVDVARYQLIGSNMANIDTPGFRTRDLDFRAELKRARMEARTPMRQEEQEESGWGDFSYASYAPVSYTAYAPVVRRVRGLLERPDGNNVSVERESLLVAETQMNYNLGVQLLKDEFHTIAQAINSGGSASS
jgi:flagellar basal-body rod protein FlgB